MIPAVLAPLDPATLAIRVDQAILRGDVIGKVGAPIDGKKPYLHIELRRDNKAIKPNRLIP